MYSPVFRIRSPDIEIRFDAPADVAALDRELKIVIPIIAELGFKS